MAIGAGVRTAEEFALVRELAEALGAALAGTRPAVDRGFIEKHQMIGQTGLAVTPEYYLAIGISGASQHQTAIGKSAKIMAINTDPRAPIVEMADRAHVGDLRAIVPQLLQQVRAGAGLDAIFGA